MDCTICVAKTKALISFAVTVKLICVFVFTYAKIRFSHDAAHLMYLACPCGCEVWLVSDPIGNPYDRFSCDAAQMGVSQLNLCDINHRCQLSFSIHAFYLFCCCFCLFLQNKPHNLGKSTLLYKKIDQGRNLL